MTRQKERIKIYTCSAGNNWKKPEWKLIEATAIETKEMFRNIEPAENRGPFGGCRVDKAEWMKSPESAIECHLRWKVMEKEGYQQRIKDAQQEIDQLQGLLNDASGNSR